MAPLIVEGDTLGQKHRNYNILVNEAIKNNPTQELDAINYEEPDLDNLFKIDLACNTRNVEYILEVLKCEDMLYISRAIKKSSWLITDEQYSYIINPEYLFNNLYPQMTARAFNKLILHIRLHLKDEKRVEDFFDYYKERDLKTAFKWLPHCSISFTENIIKKHVVDIPEQILKRLWPKSISFLEIFCRRYNSHYKRDILVPARFLVNKNIEHFLNIIEATDMSDIPGFGPKYTKRVMEKNPERIINNLEKYVYILDVSTFAKFLKEKDIKEFILTHIKNKKMRSWFTFKNIKYFLNRLPIEDRFEFIKNVFIDKACEDDDLDNNETWDYIVECCSPMQRNVSSSKNIYSWYIYAPFKKAFEDLKHLIRNESNPTERVCILEVMLKCAGRDKKNIFTLLKYYRQNHINEAFKFKIQFLSYLLSKTDTHKYDNEAWGYLNDIFKSMDVYANSDKNVQSCIKSIILYHVINGENIPEIIEKKFVFENLDNRKKFNTEEREKIFNYLYNYLTSKIKEHINNEKEFQESVNIVEKILNLLTDWNKELQDYPFILQKIKYLIKLKNENSWSCDLLNLYNHKKSWKKLLFAESIILSPSQETCINALKHGPELLEIYRQDINSLCINENNVPFSRFLKKLRIYWFHSLADSFKKTYMENLDKKCSHEALIRGLCTLLSQKELLDFVQKYVPNESKIDWSQSDELELSLRKYTAKFMHLSRPQPPLAVALLYAKGDHLQNILPSLNAILYNMSSIYISKHITELLNTPVSLQKHGIRIAFSKLKHKDLKDIFLEIWKSSKNSSIRADIFNQTFMLLCRERDESIISEIWELLSILISGLTLDENKKIYLTLSKSKDVPLSVRAQFWMKSYEFLKKLPVTANCSDLIIELSNQMDNIMEFLDNDFIAKIFLENFEKKFTSKKYEFSRHIAQFLLSTKTEKAQNERYEKIFLPIFEKALALWDEEYENTYYARYHMREIIECMSSEFQNSVLNNEMVVPIAMYTAMLDKLQNSLSIKENYTLLTYIKLSLGMMKILYDLKTRKELAISPDIKEKIDFADADVWQELQTDAAPIFGKLCLDYLKEDVVNIFPSIYVLFAGVFNDIYIDFIAYNNIIKMRALKGFLSRDFIQGYLLVLLAIPQYLYEHNEKALKLELLTEISTHSSDELAMHYWLFQKNDKCV